MNKGAELLREAIIGKRLEYSRQTGSYAYVAEYKDGKMQIIYNAASAKEARPGVDFELIARAKWSDGQGYPHWIIDCFGDEYERIDTDYQGNVIEEE